MSRDIPRKVPHGLIHDWLGVGFIPNAKIEDVLMVVRDYDHYKEMYRPGVIDSASRGTDGMKDLFSMRLVNKSVVAKTALDADREVSYIRVDDQHWYGISALRLFATPIVRRVSRDSLTTSLHQTKVAILTRVNFTVLLLWSCLLSGQTAQNPLPNSGLKDPAGPKVRFKFHTLPTSVQIYTCKQNDQGFAWSGPDPDAILTNSERTLTVHHYKGPTWEATDGSIVRSDGKLAKHFLANNKDAVHWLELPAQEPTKQFGKVTFIHRIETSGGLPPSDKPCDAPHAGDQERVNYSATYLFYAPK